jgi:hypothetical protein
MKFNLLCKLLVIFTFVFGLQPSCTVEKRLYRPGYHIEWNKKKGFDVAQKTDKTKELITETSIVEPKVEETDFISEDSLFAVLPRDNLTVSAENTRSKNERQDENAFFDAEKIESHNQQQNKGNLLQKQKLDDSEDEADWLVVLYLILGGLVLTGLGFLIAVLLSEVFVLGIIFFFFFLTVAVICFLYAILLMLYLLFRMLLLD